MELASTKTTNPLHSASGEQPKQAAESPKPRSCFTKARALVSRVLDSKLGERRKPPLSLDSMSTHSTLPSCPRHHHSRHSHDPGCHRLHRGGLLLARYDVASRAPTHETPLPLSFPQGVSEAYDILEQHVGDASDVADSWTTIPVLDIQLAPVAGDCPAEYSEVTDITWPGANRLGWCVCACSRPPTWCAGCIALGPSAQCLSAGVAQRPG